MLKSKIHFSHSFFKISNFTSEKSDSISYFLSQKINRISSEKQNLCEAICTLVVKKQNRKEQEADKNQHCRRSHLNIICSHQFSFRICLDHSDLEQERALQEALLSHPLDFPVALLPPLVLLFEDEAHKRFGFQKKEGEELKINCLFEIISNKIDAVNFPHQFTRQCRLAIQSDQHTCVISEIKILQ